MQKNYKNLIYDLIKSAPQSEADILVLKRKCIDQKEKR